MIREAKPSDVKAIVDLAVESVSRNPLPVNIDRDAMTQTLEKQSRVRLILSGYRRLMERWLAALALCQRNRFGTKGSNAASFCTTQESLEMDSD